MRTARLGMVEFGIWGWLGGPMQVGYRGPSMQREVGPDTQRCSCAHAHARAHMWAEQPPREPILHADGPSEGPASFPSGLESCPPPRVRHRPKKHSLVGPQWMATKRPLGGGPQLQTKTGPGRDPHTASIPSPPLEDLDSHTPSWLPGHCWGGGGESQASFLGCLQGPDHEGWALSPVSAPFPQGQAPAPLRLLCSSRRPQS